MALNILVCSDNHQIVESLASIAHRDGYRFMACRRGGEAVRALVVFKFDILILDLETPGLDSLFLQDPQGRRPAPQPPLEMFERADLERDPGRRRRLLTFVLVGAGCTGVELAAELHDLTQRTLVRYYPNLDVSEVRLVLADGEAIPTETVIWTG